MKKDLFILIGIIFLLGSIFISFKYFNASKKFVQTTIIDKNPGSGPWKLKTISRSEEKRKRKRLQSEVTPTSLVIKKTTSAHSIQFSSSATQDIPPPFTGSVIPDQKY